MNNTTQAKSTGEISKDNINFYLSHLGNNELAAIEALAKTLAMNTRSWQEWFNDNNGGRYSFEGDKTFIHTYSGKKKLV